MFGFGYCFVSLLLYVFGTPGFCWYVGLLDCCLG